nr:DUF2341 domain-containing protein [Kiritimatiellia bacterium]
LDAQTDADATVVLTLAAGLYGIDANMGSATLTIVNHHVAAGVDFAKKMTLTPSETVLATIGESTFADFPVLVRLPAAASAEFRTADGSDLLFTDENGTSLPFEVDTFDPAGETLVWVKVPSLTASTELTAWFGGASNIDNDPTAVWTEYVGVWHMNEPSGTVADATGHGLGASPAKATAVSVAQASGAVGTARQTSTSDVKDYLSIPNYNTQNVGANFTFSCFYDATARKGYDRLVSRKEKHDDGNGWEVEMANSSSKLSARGASATSISGSFSDLVSSGWMRFTFVYSGTTLTAFLNGAQIGTGTIAAATDNGKPLSIGCDSDGSEAYFVGYVDEARLRKGAASAAEVALEYATMADAAFFDLGEIESVDATAQAFSTPTAVRNADGTYTVTVVLSENSGDVGVIYDTGAVAITNNVQSNATPGTYTDTPANLAADTTYRFAAYGKNSNDTEVVKKGGVFYNGDLSVARVSDANENGLVPGIFRISRADTAHDLTVTYTVGGTAAAGQTYTALSGTATIPARTNSVDIVVTPLIDIQTTIDTTVTVTLAAGLYGIDAQAGSAELTVVNLVAPAGYNTWISSSNSLASIDCNWSAGHRPTSSEKVLFDGRFSTKNCEWDAAASDTVASWTQASNYTGTVLIGTEYSGMFQTFSVTGNVDLRGGRWTQITNKTANVETYRLKVSVGGNLTITSGASIDVSGCGPENGIANASFAYAADMNGTIGSTWGDPKLPTHCGKAGSNKSKAGGGGAVYLVVGGTTTLDGSILADGVRTISPYAGSYNGWGCAGSIYIETGAFTGNGLVSASIPTKLGGDNARGTPGRISIVLTAEDNAFPVNNLRAWGDHYQTDYNIGCGTIVVRNPGEDNGTLYVRNYPERSFSYNYTVPTPVQTTSIPSGDTWTFDAVVLGNYGVLTVPATSTLVLPNGWGSVSCLNSGGASSNARNWHCGIILRDGGAIQATAVGGKHEFKGGRWTFTPCSTYELSGTVEVSGGANVGVPLISQGTNNYISCHFKVNGDMDVKSGGYVSADYGGLGGNSGCDTHGYVVFPEGKGSGTGHGGQKATFGVNDAFDSFFLPCFPGSAAGHHDQRNKGAGVIDLEVTGNLHVDGTVSSCGTTFASDNHPGGPGAINIKAGTLTGLGTIKADTAAGYYGDYVKTTDGYGSSGGGRVAVRLTGSGAMFSDYWLTNITAKGYSKTGSISSKIKDDNYRYSSAGSVYLQTAVEAEKCGTIVVRNDGVAANTAYTSLPAAAKTDDIADFKKAKLLLADCGRVRLYDSLQMASMTMESHCELDLNGKTFTVKSAKLGETRLAPGTYAAGSTVAIGEGTLADYLVDTAEGTGGSLVVKGGGFAVILR